MEKERITRREFLKETGAGTLGVGIALPQMLSAQAVDYSQAPAVDRKQLVAALADTIIPTADGYLGELYTFLTIKHLTISAGKVSISH